MFKKFAQLLMIEQTLFALPFAYIGMLFASGGKPLDWLWVTLALVAARTAGMSFNRVLDAAIDAKNPRTQERHIPKGEISKQAVWALAFIACLLLIVSAFMLNRLCFYLSFAAIALLFTYSLFKRFSASSHFYLGLVEAAAPIGGYLAVKGSFDLLTFVPGIAIMFWIAGLDILYAIQDYDFDNKEGLFSVPARFGKKTAVFVSLFAYLVSIAALLVGGIVIKASIPYWCAVATVVALFTYQQIIAHKNLHNIHQSLLKVFSLNKFISPILLVGLFLDWIKRLYML